MEFAPGTVVGRYRIDGVVGRGGQGIVYRAAHVATGEAAALKAVAVAQADHVGSLRREIRALAGLRLPGVVPVLDAGLHEGLPYYVMPLLAAPTLRQLRASLTEVRATDAADVPTVVVRRGVETPGTPAVGPLPPEHAPRLMEIVSRLCRTLAALHGEGFLHRDLKPENVFVGDGDQPLLADFGMAIRGRAAGREQLEVDASIAGTLPYMAPEQLRGELLDARADLYALGCILYELLTGRPPFLGGFAQVVHQHLEDVPAPPSAYAPHVPRALDGLVGRLLEKEPRRRIGHADDVASALQAMGVAAPDGVPRARAYLYRAELEGREQAMAALRHAVDAARRRGGCCVVTGDAGAGKTRLVIELGRSLGPTTVVLAAACHEGAPALAALGAPLQAVGDRCREAGPREAERVLGGRASLLAEIEPSLATVPGAKLQDPPALPEEAARLRLFEALTSAFRAHGGSSPVMLVLDDLQWADPLLLDFATFASRPLEGTPLSIVATCRTEEQGPRLVQFLGSPHVTTLPLPRLQDGDVASMMADMLAIDDPPRDLVEAVAEPSAGNPLFVTVYLQAAVEAGILARDAEGRWRLERDADLRVPLPTSIQELLAGRLGRLSEVARSCAEAAAILGKDVEMDVLLDVLGGSEAESLAVVDELIRRRVVEESGHGRLRFCHDRIREAALSPLGEARLAELHGAAARALAPRAAVEPRLAGRLAVHWEQAGDREAARAAYEAAGRHASKVFDHATAVACYRNAVRLLVGAGEPTADLRLALASELLVTGPLDDAEAEFRAIAAESAAIGSKASAATAEAGLGNVCFTRGEIEAARRHMTAAHALAQEAEDPSLVARAIANIAVLDAAAGRLDEAAHAFHRAIDIHRQVDVARLAGNLNNLATVVDLQGRSAEARQLFLEALEVARDTGNRTEEGRAIGALGIVATHAGDFDDARCLFEAAIALHRVTGNLGEEGTSLSNLGFLFAAARRMKEAEQIHTRALHLYRLVENRSFEGAAMADLADVAAEAGRLEEAWERHHAALVILRSAGNRHLEPYVLRGIGALAIARGQADAGARCLQMSLDRSRQMGDRGTEARTLREMARHERQAGRMDSARRHLADARAIFEKLGQAIEVRRCQAQEGHLELAGGRSARMIVAEMQAAMHAAAPLTADVIGAALEPLRQAQAAFDAGQPLRHGDATPPPPAGDAAAPGDPGC